MVNAIKNQITPQSNIANRLVPTTMSEAMPNDKSKDPNLGITKPIDYKRELHRIQETSSYDHILQTLLENTVTEHNLINPYNGKKSMHYKQVSSAIKKTLDKGNGPKVKDSMYLSHIKGRTTTPFNRYRVRTYIKKDPVTHEAVETKIAHQPWQPVQG